MVGGVITSFILELLIYPVIFTIVEVAQRSEAGDRAGGELKGEV